MIFRGDRGMPRIEIHVLVTARKARYDSMTINVTMLFDSEEPERAEHSLV